MLDVHPPHHAATTWRDFLVHIATIVIGLLIAIGLEQTVEFFHHRHQVAETRQALRDESEQNTANFARESREFRRHTVQLQTNLAVLLFLQQHPGAQAAQLPGIVNWHSNFYVALSHTAWKTAQQSNVTTLMPQSEVRATDRLYDMLDNLREESRQNLLAIEDARRYTVQDADPAHLSPADLAVEIDRARLLLQWHYRIGTDMSILSRSYPEFNPAPTLEELRQIIHDTPTQ